MVAVCIVYREVGKEGGEVVYPWGEGSMDGEVSERARKTVGKVGVTGVEKFDG